MENWSLLGSLVDKIDRGRSIQSSLKELEYRTKLTSKEHRQLSGLLTEVYRRLNVIDGLIKIDFPNISIMKIPPPIRAQARIIGYLRHFKSDLAFPTDANSNEFIQAVLRHDIEEVVQRATTDFEYLGFRYFFPPWLVRLLTETWGRKEAIRIMEGLNTPPDTFFRINPPKANNVIQSLKDQGFEFTPIRGFPYYYRLTRSPIGLPATSEFNNGELVIQDLASAKAAIVASKGVSENETILDACAAPGSKTTYMRSLRPYANIFAAEYSSRRIKILKRRLKLLGVEESIFIINSDSRALPISTKTSFSRILVDPPCTGIGTIGSHPELKWRLKKRMIKWYTKVQQQILDQMARYVPKGGELIYSTCTLTREENMDQIDRFLAKHKHFELGEPLRDPELGQVNLVKNAEIMLPHKTKTEGFFITRLIKTN